MYFIVLIIYYSFVFVNLISFKGPRSAQSWLCRSASNTSTGLLVARLCVAVNDEGYKHHWKAWHIRC
jgi:hypothetical protein